MQPTVIQGPAFVIHDGYTFYTKSNVTVRYVVKSWEPATANFGPLGPRHQSRMAVISFTPAGMVTAATMSKYWPKQPSNVGASIFNGSVAVVPQAGNKITFARGGITRYAPATFSPLSTIWGAMEISCLGDPSKEPTNAAYFQTIAATAADTTFDETKIISPRYTAALGSTITGIEPDNAGFIVDPGLMIKPMSAGNYGDVDMILEGMRMRCRVRPVSWTEANMATYSGLQDAAAIRPGDSYGTADSLVITGTGLAVTLPKMGVMDAGLVYGVAEWRAGEVAFAQKLSSTTGVPDALWSAA